MATKFRRDTLLKRGIQGLVNLYYKPTFVSLCKRSHDYCYLLKATGSDEIDEEALESQKEAFWADTAGEIDFKAIKEDLGAYLDDVFEQKQGNDGIRQFHGEYWQLKWTRGNLGPITVDLDQLISFCLIMQSLQQALQNKQYDQFRVLEESTQAQKVYELSQDYDATPKEIGTNSITTYKASAHNTFGIDLIEAHPWEDPVDTIQDIENARWDNFIQFVRSLLFCFHQKHGGLQRLAACEVCGKLIYQVRLKDERTCSQVCRSKKSYVEDPDRSRCRHRQLSFLANAELRVPDIRPHGLIKDDCKQCQIQDVTKIRASQCPLVQRRNKKLIEKFNERKGKWSSKSS